jgi:hypothetical protein
MLSLLSSTRCPCYQVHAVLVIKYTLSLLSNTRCPCYQVYVVLVIMFTLYMLKTLLYLLPRSHVLVTKDIYAHVNKYTFITSAGCPCYTITQLSTQQVQQVLDIECSDVLVNKDKSLDMALPLSISTSVLDTMLHCTCCVTSTLCIYCEQVHVFESWIQ